MDQVGCTITPVRFTVGSLMFWSGVLERVVVWKPWLLIFVTLLSLQKQQGQESRCLGRFCMFAMPLWSNRYNVLLAAKLYRLCTEEILTQYIHWGICRLDRVEVLPQCTFIDKYIIPGDCNIDRIIRRALISEKVWSTKQLKLAKNQQRLRAKTQPQSSDTS